MPQYEEPPCDIAEGLKAIALWDYQAGSLPSGSGSLSIYYLMFKMSVVADGTEISFEPDDIITDIDKVGAVKSCLPSLLSYSCVEQRKETH